MPDLPISGLPNAAALAGTEPVPIVQGGVTVKTTAAAIAALATGGVTDGDKGDITVSSSGTVWTVDPSVISNSKLANVATATFKGRTTAGTGAPEDMTVAQAKTLLNLSGTNTGDQTITLTGDVTGSGTGSFSATIANDTVTNAKAANMATATIKGRTTAGTGDPEDLTATQVKTLLAIAAGDVSGLAAIATSGNASDLAGTKPSTFITDFTEAAQDSVGVMVDSTIVYNDATPSLGRAAITGDITISAGSNAATIPPGTVTLAKQANLAANSIVGNNTGSAATPIALTATQATAMLDVFTGAAKGLVPASGGGTSNFLRADGTFAAPPTGGASNHAALSNLDYASAGHTGFEPSIAAGTTAQYWRGDKSFQALDKSAVGLGNVDNTSDATKNAATATLTNKTISGASNTLTDIGNASLTNSAITIAGTGTSLGGSITRDTITGLSGNGIVVRTAANTLTNRTITGTANEITATNGDGVSGDPTISLPSAMTFTGKTVTGGTFSDGSFSGTILVNTSTPLEIVDESANVIGLIDSATSDAGLSGVAPQIFLGTNAPSSDNSAILIGRNLSGSRAGGSHGVRDESIYNASGAGLYGYASFDSIPTASGSAAYNHIASFQSRIQYTGSGSIPNIQGLTYQTTHSGSGTINQSIGVFIDDDLGTGPITSQIGMYFDQLSRGSNNYSIYSSGTQQSYHEGLWQVGNNVQAGGALLAFKSGQTDPGQIVAGTQHRTIGAPATSVIEQWDSFSAASAFIARRSNGTSASPTRLTTGDAIYSILARGRYDGGYSGTAAQLAFEAAEDWTASNIVGTRIRFLTGITGGGGVGERMQISGSGNLLVGTTADIAGPGKIKALGIDDTPIGSVTPNTGAFTSLVSSTAQFTSFGIGILTTNGSGVVDDSTGTQVTAMLDTFTSVAKGLVPASSGGTTTFLRADGTFATPSGSSPTTTKGDLIARSSSADSRLPVGTNGQVLTADSAETLGVKWATPSGGGGSPNLAHVENMDSGWPNFTGGWVAAYNNGDIQKVTFTSEIVDQSSAWNTTNNEYTCPEDGTYILMATPTMVSDYGGQRKGALYVTKNGTSSYATDIVSTLDDNNRQRGACIAWMIPCSTGDILSLGYSVYQSTTRVSFRFEIAKI